MLKKIISKVFRSAEDASKMPFWLWLDRKTKIAALRKRLDKALSKEGITKAELYSIAEAQQELLNKKNGE